MKFRKSINVILLLTLMIIWSRCDSLNPVSLGPQPIILNAVEYEPMLNVFGIIRRGTLNGGPRSYILLERSFSSENAPDSVVIIDADVKIIQSDTSAVTTIQFSVVQPEWSEQPIYQNESFYPLPGKYELICEKKGYPVLRGTTIMPQVPEIEEGSIQVVNEVLHFNIIRDERAGLYEIVIIGVRGSERGRFIRSHSGNTEISLSVKGIIGTDIVSLFVYAYDLNLSNYLTANLSIKPNIYHRGFSTVENGYGCFGSMNMLYQLVAL